jgi:hypothetical protein
LHDAVFAMGRIFAIHNKVIIIIPDPLVHLLTKYFLKFVPPWRDGAPSLVVRLLRNARSTWTARGANSWLLGRRCCGSGLVAAGLHCGRTVGCRRDRAGTNVAERWPSSWTMPTFGRPRRRGNGPYARWSRGTSCGRCSSGDTLI